MKGQHTTIDEYHRQQAQCEGLCDITDVVVQEAELMRCVRCPFCEKTVNAILTENTISCPACNVTVKRR